MITRIKILTTTEQTIEIDSNGNTQVVSSKVINTTIKNGQTNIVLNPVQYQFNSSESKYGIISLKKDNPMRSLYSPGNKINISVNGQNSIGKWHSKQCRVDGLSKLFSKFADLEARVFNLSYDALTNTLIFTEV